MAYDDAGNFQNSLSVTLGAGPYNDLGGSTLQTYSKGLTLIYRSGTTNRLVLTAASGNSTINSLDASGVSDGFTILLLNASTTDDLIFTHLGGGIATNQFSNVSAGSVALLPLGAARCTYVISNWRFA
jgi:hypothetical protein